MGKLVIKLDRPIIVCVIEGNQLLSAENLDPAEVSTLLDTIGDYPISEVAIYMKFDTRQNVDGVIVDRILSSYIDYSFRIAESDYNFIKAVAIRFNAAKLSIYSAYRHYLMIADDGIIVDSYVDQSYIVAALQDGQVVSLNICSAERLQRTIDACQQFDVTYSAHGTIPELDNIELVPAEYHETLAFLQFIKNGQPCYQIDIDTGEVFEYGDKDPASKYYKLLPEEESLAIATIVKNLGPKTVARNKGFTIKSLMTSAVCLVLGLLLGTAIIGMSALEERSVLLNNKLVVQRNQMDMQEFEERFLRYGIEDDTSGLFYMQYSDIYSIIGNNGAILSIRFVFSKAELTLFVLSEAMLEQAITNLSEYYIIDSYSYEGPVTGGLQSQTYLQYNIVLDLALDH